MCCNAKNLLQFKNHFFLTNYVHIYVSQKIKKRMDSLFRHATFRLEFTFLALDFTCSVT